MRVSAGRTFLGVGSIACGAMLAVVFACGTPAAAQRLLAVELPGVPAAELPVTPSALLQRAAGAEVKPDASGQVRGVVVDANGGLVPGAIVKLERNKGLGFLSDTPKPGDLEAKYEPMAEGRSDAGGSFAFLGLPAGVYRVLISANGLQPFLSDRISLQAGQHFELPETALPVAATGMAVTVYATSAEVAEAELKLETQQRVLGIAPNFYESFVWNAAPLNTRQKFKLATKSRIDPFIILPTAVRAAIQTERDTYPGWGTDPASFGKRFGAAYGDALIGRFLGAAVFPSIFRQDPRYFYMGPAQPGKKRFYHAILAGVEARGDNGKTQPNYSHVMGNAAAGAVSTVYHPAGTGAGTLAWQNAVFGIAGTGVEGLFREFVLDHFTHKVPGYAKGEPADGK